MSAPASPHERARRRIGLVVEREYQPDPARCVAAIVKLLAYRPSAEPCAAPTTDAAHQPAPDQPAPDAG